MGYEPRNDVHIGGCVITLKGEAATAAGVEKVKPPFTLLPVDAVSHDTVKCLERLLEQARAGEAIGIAYAVMYKRRKFAVHMCGEAHRNPTFTRGMIAALDDELGFRVRA